MAKHGINKNIDLKVVGILDIRQDGEKIYIEIEDETYALTELLSGYDGEDITISTSKQVKDSDDSLDGEPL